jgi:succinate dehydrogenase/fumarate reductase cytochrome b subunit
LHSALGLLLLGFVLLHLWAQWPALQSRDAWVDRAFSDATRQMLLALVFAALAGHVALGWRRLQARLRAGDAQLGLARVQAISGGLVLAFIGYHLWHTWRATGAHAGLEQPYAVLWQTLGRPAELLVYLVGLTAVSFHLGHGLGRAAQSWGLVRAERGVVAARWFGGFVGLCVWLACIQLLARFALGTALWPL